MSTATSSAKPRMGQVYVDLPSVRHTPKAAHATDPPPSSRKPRFSQVYVEMPPLFSARAKENRSIPFNDGSSVDASVSRKRKRADSAVVLVSDVSHPNMKERPKAKKPRSSDNPPPAVLSNHKMKADEGTSHDSGTFYCHQCNYKRDNSAGLHCTYIASKNVRCKAKYCDICLLRRYELDVDSIRRPSSPVKANQKTDHVSGAGYLFKCPRCQDDCNCWKCRKAKGLEPLGRFAADKKAAIVIARTEDELDLLNSTNDARSESSSGSKDAGNNKASGSKAGAGKPAAKSHPSAHPAVVKPAARAVPILDWKLLPVHEGFSLEAAEARIHIREFVLRFAGLFEITKSRLDELDDIVGDELDVEDENDEECVTSTWISEVCLREILVGLLATIGDEAHGPEQKAIELAVKNLRNSGANLTKMWTALSNLRDILHSSGSELPRLPDPLPPPSAAAVRNTRGTAKADGAPVVHTAQLVPVVQALIEAALATEQLREILDAGADEVKEAQKEAREAVKREKERWEAEGGAKNKSKEVRETHKQRLTDIDRALDLVCTAYGPRCAPLGTDSAGRVYWVLTPHAEYEAARDILTAPTGDKKGAGTRRSTRGTKAVVAPNDERRKEMSHWPWLVAVWGTKPSAAVKKRATAGAHNADEEEQWWGFWDAKDIANLVEWLDITHGTPETVNRRKSMTTSLVSGLRDYAKLLKWRCRTGEVKSAAGTASGPAKKAPAVAGTVKTAKFYG